MFKCFKWTELYTIWNLRCGKEQTEFKTRYHLPKEDKVIFLTKHPTHYDGGCRYSVISMLSCVSKGLQFKIYAHLISENYYILNYWIAEYLATDHFSLFIKNVIITNLDGSRSLTSIIYITIIALNFIYYWFWNVSFHLSDCPTNVLLLSMQSLIPAFWIYLHSIHSSFPFLFQTGQ